ncbi:MAG: hypothetical protein HYT31_02860 [Parcubacteria group bacterium]|nr:hypothetical protein [Parcubacteria group bacterium]
MEETSNTKQKGFLLIASLFVLSTMMVIVGFYVSSVTQEVKVASIVDTAPQAYYLAEAGIVDARWKLSNDAAYKTNFETNPSWSTSFTRTDALIPGASYAVSIENSGLANAVITATSTVSVRDTQTQRVVRANAFKALNDTPTAGIAVYAKGELYGAGSNVSAIGGDFYAGSEIDLNLFSSWTTDGDALSAGTIDVSITSDLSATGVYDQGNPPIPGYIDMPQIDFDSSDPSSFKSRANQTYNTGEWNQLLRDFPVLTLEGITYVTGNAEIKKGTALTINGILVADGSIKIGNGYSSQQDPARVIVNKTPGEPSGLIAKNDIDIGGYSSDIDVAGLIYAGSRLRVLDGMTQNVTLDVAGGIVAQNVEVLVAWQPLTVTFDQAAVSDALGEPLFSQVIITDHWEEEY